MRPTWGPDGTLVFAVNPGSLGSKVGLEKPGILSLRKNVIQEEHREIGMAKFSNEVSLTEVTHNPFGEVGD
jgi:hypothetical protein